MVWIRRQEHTRHHILHCISFPPAAIFSSPTPTVATLHRRFLDPTHHPLVQGHHLLVSYIVSCRVSYYLAHLCCPSSTFWYFFLFCFLLVPFCTLVYFVELLYRLSPSLGLPRLLPPRLRSVAGSSSEPFAQPRSKKKIGDEDKEILRTG